MFTAGIAHTKLCYRNLSGLYDKRVDPGHLRLSCPMFHLAKHPFVGISGLSLNDGLYGPFQIRRLECAVAEARLGLAENLTSELIVLSYGLFHRHPKTTEHESDQPPSQDSDIHSSKPNKGHCLPSRTSSPDEMKIVARSGTFLKLKIMLKALHDLVQNDQFRYTSDTSTVCSYKGWLEKVENSSPNTYRAQAASVVLVQLLQPTF
jgi:hypothetical protein